MQFEISIDGKVHRLELNRSGNQWTCRLDGREVVADVEEINSDILSILISGKSFEVRRIEVRRIDDTALLVNGQLCDVVVEDPRSWRGRRRSGAGTEGPQKLSASMPGKIVRVLAKEGEEIKAGQGIAVIEAMKMQNEIKSPKAGTLKKLLAQVGMNVTAGEVLAIVE